MALQARCIRLLPVGQTTVPGLARAYATNNSLGASTTQPQSTRRRVTVINDDGRVPWGQLSNKEKVARTTQQTVNFSVVVIGGLATAAVAYLMYDQVFSTDSKTAHFNRAFDELKDSQRVIDALGPANQLSAHGEGSWSKWSRNRSIASRMEQDGAGRDHLIMQFYVEGPKNRGIVKLHMVRPEANAPFAYKTFTVDVPGHNTIYLRNEKTPGDKKRGMRFLGVQWS